MCLPLNEIIFSCITVLVSVFTMCATWYNADKSYKANQGNLILHLKELDMINKSRFAKAMLESESIKKWVKENWMDLKFSSFIEEFSKNEYTNIREVMYFYEYLGSLVKMRQLDFKQVFSLIYFPDNIDDSIDGLIYKVKGKKSDFMENYRYLKKLYIKKRNSERNGEHED